MEQVQEISAHTGDEMKQPWLVKHWQKLVAAGLWVAHDWSAHLVYAHERAHALEVFLVGLEWAQTSPMAPLAYIVIYAIRPLTLFSSVLLTIGRRFLFGPTWGIVYTVIGANLSATVAFFVGRYFGRRRLGRRRARKGWCSAMRAACATTASRQF